MKKDTMNKIQKAIAKLYFAIGEAGTQTPTNAEITEATAEYMAFLAIRDTGKALGVKYLAMGAAAAHRRAAKPPRGKIHRNPDTREALPPKGKKQVKQAKPEKVKRKNKELDFEDDFENDWEE